LEVLIDVSFKSPFGDIFVSCAFRYFVELIEYLERWDLRIFFDAFLKKTL
jgi:hypothetical protein